jgi:hypothetical protein
MNADILTKIKAIIEDDNIPIRVKSTNIKGYIADMVPDFQPKQRNILAKSLELGFVQTLKDTDISERTYCKQQLVKKLHDIEGFDINLCGETLNFVENVLFGDIGLIPFSDVKNNTIAGSIEQMRILTITRRGYKNDDNLYKVTVDGNILACFERGKSRTINIFSDTAIVKISNQTHGTRLELKLHIGEKIPQICFRYILKRNKFEIIICDVTILDIQGDCILKDVQGGNSCSKCGQNLRIGAKFCSRCGYVHQNNQNNNAN